jgi:hypothetical protein
MDIKAVTNNVKLRLYLWHDFYSIFLKIDPTLHYTHPPGPQSKGLRERLVLLFCYFYFFTFVA